MAYTQTTISGYNANPPPDDGTALSTNTVKWITIKQKLFDPVNVGLPLIDDRTLSAFTTADTSLATLQAAVSVATSNITALQTTLNAAAGTAMLFHQTSAPTGWTKQSTYNDYALRLVTGTPSTGGSTAFSSILAARTVATANLPSHTHTFSQSTVAVAFSSTTFNYALSDDTTGILGGGTNDGYLTSVGGSSGTVTVSVVCSGTTSVAGTGSTWDFAVNYVDLIYATKS